MKKNDQSVPYIIVDGSSYLYRAYHALPPLTTSLGQPTGAIRGVASMLKRLIADHDPQYMAVVFDAKGKNFRHEIYSEYKANRPPMPDDLRVQIEPLNQLIHAMGLPLLVVEGVEADDVIGTLARQATEEGLPLLISSSDKDLAQLVSDYVTLVDTMSDTQLDRDGVINKFGVPPEQIAEYLALMGDSSDNIPGIPKVGAKTAAKWLNQFGSLAALIDRAAEVKGKIGENLRNNLSQLTMSLRLTEINCQVELPLNTNQLERRPSNLDELSQIYQQLEFKSWLSEFNQDGVAPEQTSQQLNFEYQTILEEAELAALAAALETATCLAIDTETTSLSSMSAKLVGISLSAQSNQAFYIPLGHDYEGAPAQLSLDQVKLHLQPIFEKTTIKLIGQNLKYDMTVLERHGIRLSGDQFDTMLASYVLNSTGHRHDMDTLAKTYLNHETVSFESIAGKGAKQKTFNQIALEVAAQYAAEDAAVTFALFEVLNEKLEACQPLKEVFEQIEMPLVPVLARMEQEGTYIDQSQLAQQSKEIAEKIETLEETAYKLAGQAFNLSSPKQLQEIFYEKLGLPVLKKTPKGQPSTAEPVLHDLAHHHELPALILEHRGLSKLKNTYTDQLPKQINPQTGRVHTSYHQAVTATGRLSSSDPNLQNIPIKNQQGRRIRKAFVAAEGFSIIAADYSQIELRIMAHLSRDQSLLDAFAQNLDIHQATAAQVFSVKPEAVTAEMRRKAKAINFGLIYGMSAFGLANQIGVDRATAQSYIDLYFSQYPGVKTYMDQTRTLAHEQGYVETCFGRRLFLPEIHARNKMRQQAAERTAINAPMQGTAADLIKLAMTQLAQWLGANDSKVKMIMQVHDELVFEVPTAEVAHFSKIIKEKMETAGKLLVPLLVEVGVGENWDEAH